MLLAIDDTDDADGGCTTHLVFHILLALPELALRGMPRLVRLNPNIPWKTRGNGAIALPLCEPSGPQVRVGELRGHEILAFPEGTPPTTPARDILERAWKVIERECQPGSSPAAALFNAPPSSLAYWSAVGGTVDPEEARAMLAATETPHRYFGEGRGLVGCMAAAAWPGPPSSFEFIAYREPRKWGTSRELEPEPLRDLDARGHTFHTWDPVIDRPACIPNTPCPVLCGLRGHDPDRLQRAAVLALSAGAKESVDGWIMWATNQASGDHVTPIEHIESELDHATVQMPATVTSAPLTKQGGHVHVPMQDIMGTPFTAVAFEPTKNFRDTVRNLRPGDDVTVVGAWDSHTIRLEKLEVRTLAMPHRKIANPPCPACGRRMKSRGTDAGYRCPDGHTTAPADAAEIEAEPRQLATGWHEVPIIARRHLHRPLAFDE